MLFPLGGVKTPSGAVSLAVNGSIVYLCDTFELSVVDATDPTKPVLLRTVPGQGFHLEL